MDTPLSPTTTPTAPPTSCWTLALRWAWLEEEASGHDGSRPLLCRHRPCAVATTPRHPHFGNPQFDDSHWVFGLVLSGLEEGMDTGPVPPPPPPLPFADPPLRGVPPADLQRVGGRLIWSVGRRKSGASSHLTRAVYKSYTPKRAILWGGGRGWKVCVSTSEPFPLRVPQSPMALLPPGHPPKYRRSTGGLADGRTRCSKVDWTHRRVLYLTKDRVGDRGHTVRCARPVRNVGHFGPAFPRWPR